MSKDKRSILRLPESEVQEQSSAASTKKAIAQIKQKVGPTTNHKNLKGGVDARKKGINIDVGQNKMRLIGEFGQKQDVEDETGSHAHKEPKGDEWQSLEERQSRIESVLPCALCIICVVAVVIMYLLTKFRAFEELENEPIDLTSSTKFPIQTPPDSNNNDANNSTNNNTWSASNSPASSPNHHLTFSDQSISSSSSLKLSLSAAARKLLGTKRNTSATQNNSHWSTVPTTRRSVVNKTTKTETTGATRNATSGAPSAKR